MPALYPISVAAEDYKVGDNVKWFAGGLPSDYVGKVTAISPKTYKVWVTWPIGETQQHAPEELILVPKYQGMSVVQEDNGYDSYDKQISALTFGKMSPSLRDKNAAAVADRFQGYKEASEKMAAFRESVEKLANEHLVKLSTMLEEDIQECKTAGLTSIQAYGDVFDKHGLLMGDAVIKQALLDAYPEG